MDEQTRQLIQSRVLSRLREAKPFPQSVIETLKMLTNSWTSMDIVDKVSWEMELMEA